MRRVGLAGPAGLAVCATTVGAWAQHCNNCVDSWKNGNPYGHRCDEEPPEGIHFLTNPNNPNLSVAASFFEPDRRPVYVIRMSPQDSVKNNPPGQQFNWSSETQGVAWLLGELQTAYDSGYRRFCLRYPAGRFAYTSNDGGCTDPDSGKGVSLSQFWTLQGFQREAFEPGGAVHAWVNDPAHADASIIVYAGKRLVHPCSLCLTECDKGWSWENCAAWLGAGDPGNLISVTSQAEMGDVWLSVSPWFRGVATDVYLDGASQLLEPLFGAMLEAQEFDYRPDPELTSFRTFGAEPMPRTAFLRQPGNKICQGLTQSILKAGPVWMIEEFEWRNRECLGCDKPRWTVQTVDLDCYDPSYGRAGRFNPCNTEVGIAVARLPEHAPKPCNDLNGEAVLPDIRRVLELHDMRYVLWCYNGGIGGREDQMIKRVVGFGHIESAGDFNANGMVDSDDFIFFLERFVSHDPGACRVTYIDGDVNGDGGVDSDDFVQFFLLFTNPDLDLELPAGGPRTDCFCGG